MIAISPKMTEGIDRFAEEQLGIPTKLLMERAGLAVAKRVAERIPVGGRVLILAGGGNNGGDGYAAAIALAERGYCAIVCDVLLRGQRSEAGRHFLAAYKRAVGEPISLDEAEKWPHDCLVDAILGTGAHMPLSEALYPAAALIKRSSAYKIAVDLPLGADAEDGLVDPHAVRVDETLMLGFPKYGLYSYPAREYVGRLMLDDIGLDTRQVRALIGDSEHLCALSDIKALLPTRERNSHKGSFGHLLLLAGSRRYRGAPLMAAAAALRMGAGLCTLASCDEVCAAAAIALPELILAPLSAHDDILPLCEGRSAILLGCGSGSDDVTAERTYTLLATEGAPLLLDADGINVLATPEGRIRLAETKRRVILTPHPAEFARLIGKDTATVQAERLPMARRFAAAYPHITLVLKGAATIVAEGERFAINQTGGPALAKGGSGDVLAGAIASLLATGLSAYDAARIGVCLHGAAGDRLEGRYSPLGVRPTDLPSAMAEVLAGCLV